MSSFPLASLPLELLLNICKKLDPVDCTCLALTNRALYDSIRAVVSKNGLLFGADAKIVTLNLDNGKHCFTRMLWCILMERLEDCFGSEYMWCPHQTIQTKEPCELCEEDIKRHQSDENASGSRPDPLQSYPMCCKCGKGEKSIRLERRWTIDIEERHRRRFGAVSE